LEELLDSVNPSELLTPESLKGSDEESSHAESNPKEIAVRMNPIAALWLQDALLENFEYNNFFIGPPLCFFVSMNTNKYSMFWNQLNTLHHLI
jgi:hypothetical protein